MPTNKNAQLRYQILDRCFSDFHRKYFIEDLMDKVNDALMDLYGTQISIRQIREDIQYMKDRVTYNAAIEVYLCEGRKCYYRYSDKSFSIFNNELSVEEVASLRSTIDILGRFQGVPTNAWLEDVISNLEFRFGVRPNPENVVSFEHNDLLKGTEFLGELIDSALNLFYHTFAGNEQTTTIHPSQETADDKEHIIRLRVRPNKELEARIFSYGNQVEVLKSEWLRRQIKEKLQEILKKYSSVQEDCNI